MSEELQNNEIKQTEATTEVDTSTVKVGEIVDHSGEIKEKVEETVEPAVEEAIEKTETENPEVTETIEEKSEEDTKDTDSVDEPETTEEKTEESKEEQVTEEEKTEEVTEEETKEEDKEEVTDEVEEIDIEQIKKELEELKAEKEEEARVKELVEVANHVEAEYDRVVKGINQALKETLEQYQIPTDKTIDELRKEDPAKAEIAQALIAQAKQALDFNTHQLSTMYKTKEQDVIFTKAERIFNRYELTPDQAGIAADTFIQIINAAGLQDLNEDLIAKVELSVAQARFKAPAVVTPPVVEAPVVTNEPEATVDEVKTESKVEPEAVAEPEKVDKKVDEGEHKEAEEKVEAEPPISEIKRGVAKQSPTRKVDLSGYKEGIEGGAKSAASPIDTENVLHKLASLPYRERQAFLKQNKTLVDKAMRDFNTKHQNKRR